jgi:hypothetical protein
MELSNLLSSVTGLTGRSFGGGDGGGTRRSEETTG